MSLCGLAAASGSTARPSGQQKSPPLIQESPKGEKWVDSPLIKEPILGILSAAPATNDRCSKNDEAEFYTLLQELLIEDTRCTRNKDAINLTGVWYMEMNTMRTRSHWLLVPPMTMTTMMTITKITTRIYWWNMHIAINTEDQLRSPSSQTGLWCKNVRTWSLWLQTVTTMTIFRTNQKGTFVRMTSPRGNGPQANQQLSQFHHWMGHNTKQQVFIASQNTGGWYQQKVPTA